MPSRLCLRPILVQCSIPVFRTTKVVVERGKCLPLSQSYSNSITEHKINLIADQIENWISQDGFMNEKLVGDRASKLDET